MAIDWDAYIVNRTLGTSVPESLAGSVIEDSRMPAPITRRDRAGRSLGWLIGASVMLAWTIWRAL
jgi:hypothetical protein